MVIPGVLFCLLNWKAFLQSRRPWLADTTTHNVWYGMYDVAVICGCFCLRALNTLAGIKKNKQKTNKKQHLTSCGHLHLQFSVFIQNSKHLCYLRQLPWYACSLSREFCLVHKDFNLKCYVFIIKRLCCMLVWSAGHAAGSAVWGGGVVGAAGERLGDQRLPQRPETSGGIRGQGPSLRLTRQLGNRWSGHE